MPAPSRTPAFPRKVPGARGRWPIRIAVPWPRRGRRLWGAVGEGRTRGLGLVVVVEEEAAARRRLAAQFPPAPNPVLLISWGEDLQRGTCWGFLKEEMGCLLAFLPLFLPGAPGLW